jgi:lysophospholipase L1-like esterase
MECELMDKYKGRLFRILFLVLALAIIEYEAYHYRSAPLINQSEYNPYNTKQYAEANINILKQKEKKVVVVGDSIVEGWKFPNKINGYMLINRGISGETTDSLIGRFTNDVIKIKPQYVVILAGINDIAAIYEADPNGVDLQIQKIVSNIKLMADNAKEKEIVPIVCSVLPVNEKYRLPVQDINNAVIKLNQNLASMTKAEGMIYVDLWSIVIDQNTGMLKSDYSYDGIHLNEKAYQPMWSQLTSFVRE